MNMNLKFQESLRSSITTPVVFFVQTSTLDVCYAKGTSFKAGCFQASGFSAGGLGLFQEKSFGSVCTAASFDLFLFKYGVYEILSVFERGSTNIHFPAGVAICRAFLTSGSGA